MALQVWLPLNGDLTQQGLSGVEPINSGTTISSTGKIGQSYLFDGSGSISIPEMILPSNTSEWSFSCWFYLANNTSSTANCLFSERKARSQSGYTIFIYPLSGQMLVDDGVRWTVTPMKFSATTWYHLVVTRNMDGKKIYIDGIEKVSTSAIGTTTACNTNGCVIGGAQTGTALSTVDQYFNGNLNDVRIYDHCLSAKEVKELSKGLILHYKLNDLNTSYENIIFDCSGYNNNGNIIGTLTNNFDTNKYSASTYFEDYNDYIYCNLKNNIPDSITMSCWIKSSNKSPRGNYHNPITIHSTNFEMSIIGSSGKARMGYFVGGTRYVRDIGPDILDNQWHMLTSTCDGEKIYRYIDGELVDSQDASGVLTSLDIIRIGSVNTSYGNTQLYESDIRIYMTALSEDDILELYHTAASIDSQGNLFCGEVVE